MAQLRRECHHRQNSSLDEELLELEFELELEELLELELDELLELEFEELLELEFEELLELEFEELLELEFEELLELELEELLPAKSSGLGAVTPRPENSGTLFGAAAMLFMPPVSIDEGVAACAAPVAPVSDATAIARADAILCPFFMT